MLNKKGEIPEYLSLLKIVIFVIFLIFRFVLACENNFKNILMKF